MQKCLAVAVCFICSSMTFTRSQEIEAATSGADLCYLRVLCIRGCPLWESFLLIVPDQGRENLDTCTGTEKTVAISVDCINLFGRGADAGHYLNDCCPPLLFSFFFVLVIALFVPYHCVCVHTRNHYICTGQCVFAHVHIFRTHTSLGWAVSALQGINWLNKLRSWCAN